MKLRIPVEQLRPGMFVEAGVLSILVGGEIHHFLDLRDAAFPDSRRRRLRLDKRRHEQVSSSGGMLLRSPKQLAVFMQLGASQVCIDTDRSSVVPEQEPLESPTAAGDVIVQTDASEGGDDLALESLDGSVAIDVQNSIPEVRGRVEFSCLDQATHPWPSLLSKGPLPWIPCPEC